MTLEGGGPSQVGHLAAVNEIGAGHLQDFAFTPYHFPRAMARCRSLRLEWSSNYLGFPPPEVNPEAMTLTNHVSLPGMNCPSGRLVYNLG